MAQRHPLAGVNSVRLIRFRQINDGVELVLQDPVPEIQVDTQQRTAALAEKGLEEVEILETIRRRGRNPYEFGTEVARRREALNAALA